MIKLLIVEDEAISAMALKSKFESLGYSVCKLVTSGMKALQAAESEKPDIVLMDIRLRGEMNGIEAAIEINERYGIPTILMTGYSRENLKDFPDRPRAVELVHKPVNIRQLQEKIDNLLQAKVDESS